MKQTKKGLQKSNILKIIKNGWLYKRIEKNKRKLKTKKFAKI